MARTGLLNSTPLPGPRGLTTNTGTRYFAPGTANRLHEIRETDENGALLASFEYDDNGAVVARRDGEGAWSTGSRATTGARW